MEYRVVMLIRLFGHEWYMRESVSGSHAHCVDSVCADNDKLQHWLTEEVVCRVVGGVA